MKATAPELEELLCFDLYAASRAVTAAYRPILSEVDLTYPQYLVLVVLWGRGEGTIKELSRALRLDHGTLTPLLRRMETMGLLTRERSSTDERSVTVRLAARGESLRAHRDRIQCDVEAALGLSGDQARVLSSLLRQVTDSAQRA